MGVYKKSLEWNSLGVSNVGLFEYFIVVLKVQGSKSKQCGLIALLVWIMLIAN